MATVTAFKKITPKQKLLAKLNKTGGLTANRKSLQDLQTLFANEIPKPNVDELRKAAWRTK